PVTATITVTPSLNGCTGSPTVVTSVTVNPTPIPTISSGAPATYCNTDNGSAISFASLVSASSFTWTSSASVGFGTSGNGDISPFTATNAGSSPLIADITVTASANGCTGPATPLAS